MRRFVSIFALALVLVGLVTQNGQSQSTIDSFNFTAVSDVSIEAGPALKRQSETLTASLTVSSDVDYRIEATVVPKALGGWSFVEMNAGQHGLMTDNDWGSGFDIAITGAGDPVADPSVAACGDLAGWCMGVAAWDHSVATGGVSETNDWDIHVRLVLVDEDGETAGYNTDGDNVRFASLPSDTSRTVDVEIVVSEL